MSKNVKKEVCCFYYASLTPICLTHLFALSPLSYLLPFRQLLGGHWDLDGRCVDARRIAQARRGRCATRARLEETQQLLARVVKRVALWRRARAGRCGAVAPGCVPARGIAACSDTRRRRWGLGRRLAAHPARDKKKRE